MTHYSIKTIQISEKLAKKIKKSQSENSQTPLKQSRESSKKLNSRKRTKFFLKNRKFQQK